MFFSIALQETEQSAISIVFSNYSKGRDKEFSSFNSSWGGKKLQTEECFGYTIAQ